MTATASTGHGRAETLGSTYTAGSATSGTTVTAAGSANTKGSWASLGTPSFQYEFVNVGVMQVAASAKMFDLGINDGSGNWHVIAGDLHLPGNKQADLMWSYALPLRVKSGQELGMRVQASTASHTLICSITGFSKGVNGAPGYSRLERISTSGTSRGTNVDAGATANTKGAWAQLNASTSNAYDALYCVLGFGGDTSRTATATALLDIGVGAAASEQVLIENYFLRWSTTNDGPELNVGVLPIPIGSSKRVVARLACSDTVDGDRDLDINLYGFIP